MREYSIKIEMKEMQRKREKIREKVINEVNFRKRKRNHQQRIQIFIRVLVFISFKIL